MGLFLDGIFDKDNRSPSAVTIEYPVINETLGADSRAVMTGLMVSEPTMSTSINWGPILNDVSNIQDISSLIGASQMWTWIGASAMCWKGTSPLSTSIEFYLINYKPNLMIESELAQLNRLTSLIRLHGNEKVAVQVHGGYTAPVLQSNSDYFNNNSNSEKLKKGFKANQKSIMDNIANAIFEPNSQIDMEKGTLTLTFGRKMRISHMLIKRLDVTPSIVEVPDGKPLYYRVTMQLTGSRPLISTDVAEMYRRY